MLVPSISNLRTEDFPSEKSWISKLLGPINQFLNSASTALNGNITFSDNIPCQLIKLNFLSGGADFPKIIKWDIAQNNPNPNATLAAPVEVRVCSATENGIGIAVVMAWSFANGTITFPYIVKLTASGVVGLTAGARYNIVLRGQP